MSAARSCAHPFLTSAGSAGSVCSITHPECSVHCAHRLRDSRQDLPSVPLAARTPRRAAAARGRSPMRTLCASWIQYFAYYCFLQCMSGRRRADSVLAQSGVSNTAQYCRACDQQSGNGSIARPGAQFTVCADKRNSQGSWPARRIWLSASVS
jgi:hypothetical protein